MAVVVVFFVFYQFCCCCPTDGVKKQTYEQLQNATTTTKKNTERSNQSNPGTPLTYMCPESARQTNNNTYEEATERAPAIKLIICNLYICLYCRISTTNKYDVF